jgi:hypothetical protein
VTETGADMGGLHAEPSTQIDWWSNCFPQWKRTEPYPTPDAPPSGVG